MGKNSHAPYSVNQLKTIKLLKNCPDSTNQVTKKLTPLPVVLFQQGTTTKSSATYPINLYLTPYLKRTAITSFPLL